MMAISQAIFVHMEELITRSWERSQGYGVDPHIGKAPENSRLKPKELSVCIESQQAFFNVAKKEIDNLYTLLKDTGFCLALADKDGYVLYVIGDADLEEHFRVRHCMPGYRWLEQDMGTCAIGLTIVEQVPIFLPGNRMYASHAKRISNAGAPIFGIQGELLGAISLSGYSNLMHAHTLGLVCQAAMAVTSHLKDDMRLREIAIQNQYMNAVLEAGTRGIVTVDQKGCIVQTNRKARFLLDLPDNYIGKEFAKFFKTTLKLSNLLKNGTNLLAREIMSNKGRCFISLAPVHMENNEMVGAIITITESKEMVELAMKMTGSNAHFTFQSIVGKSKNLHNAMHVAKIAATNNAPVLILGETGTGKELFAQAIHNAGARKNKPFVAINCGAIPKELLESELFGYEEGAFTGAQKGGRLGKLELADTGTLFLDEIADMPFDMQVKLLRVL